MMHHCEERRRPTTLKSTDDFACAVVFVLRVFCFDGLGLVLCQRLGLGI